MQAKTTRAFRTISEAAEELDLQPHVLRFWESKFPSFKPIKRGGGRRFYRPEDIEFLRGIKVLLHDERHPIKDVQKLIRVKGVARIVELGRSVEKAATPKDIKDTVLVPDRIRTKKPTLKVEKPVPEEPVYLPAETDEFTSDEFFPKDESETISEQPEPEPAVQVAAEEPQLPTSTVAENTISLKERKDLELALERLQKLRNHWQDFQKDLSNN